MSLPIRHYVNRDDRAPVGDCVWCGKPSEVVAETPNRPDLGRVPLHLFCGQFMRDAFREWQETGTPPTWALDNLKRLSP